MLLRVKTAIKESAIQPVTDTRNSVSLTQEIFSLSLTHCLLVVKVRLISFLMITDDDSLLPDDGKKLNRAPFFISLIVCNNGIVKYVYRVRQKNC